MRGGRHVGRWLLLGLVLALGAVAGLAAWRLDTIARDLVAARDLIGSASTAIEQGDLDGAANDLGQAQGLLLQANNSLSTRPELQLVGAFPGVRQNLGSLRDSVQVALRLVVGGRDLVDTVGPLRRDDGTIQVPLRDGAVPLDIVTELAQEVESLAATLPGEGDRPGDFLLTGRVASLQRAVYDEAITQRDRLADVGNALALLSEMAGANGPRRYLLAVANTAEMRGTGGMILSYGVLEADGGEFTLPTFGPIDELFLDEPLEGTDDLVAPDEAARWGALEPTRLWRNANVLPDFTIVGPRLAAMYAQATGSTVDGVIQIDAQGLAAILRGIGPVTVPEVGTVTADNVVDLVLNQVYSTFDDDLDQRREVLGEVAEVVFDRLVDGDYESLRPLAEALVTATDERHVLLYGGTREAARAASYFHADGALPDAGTEFADSFLLTVQNFGRDKLDYYVDTAVAVTGTRRAAEPGQLDLAVTVTNGAPVGQEDPAYVFGDAASGRVGPPGLYQGTASLYVPVGAVVEGVDSGGEDGVDPGALGTEDGRPVLGIDFEVPAGESRTAVVHLRLPTRPSGVAGLALVPTPRVHPTVWDVDIDTGTGRLRRTGPLDYLEFVVEDPQAGG